MSTSMTLNDLEP